MNSNIIADAAPITTEPLRLFTLYEDFEAGVRAKLLADRIINRTGNNYVILKGMWRMGSAKPIGRIHQMMARDAAESDVLLIASTSVDQTQATIIRWLYSLLGWRSNPMLPGLLIGLIGDEEQPASDSDWLVGQLSAFTGRNHLEFAWHSGSESITDCGWIDPLLEKLFARKDSIRASRLELHTAEVGRIS